MTTSRDIEAIIAQVQQKLPQVNVQQHVVSHPGIDDDGVWWFSLPDVKKDIQIESSSGTCPFLVEHDDMTSRNQAQQGRKVEEVVDMIVSYLTAKVS